MSATRRSTAAWVSLLVTSCGASSTDPDAGPPDAAECEEPEFCYSGPPGTEGIGVCSVGLRRCVDGQWTTCEAEVVPSDEVCDTEDDDCDGTVDEGVTGACGDCDANCRRVCVGLDCDLPFEEPSAIALQPSAVTGCLELDVAAGTGTYSTIFEYQLGLHWVAAGFRAELAPDSTVSVELRAADRVGDLALAPWTVVGVAPPDAEPLPIPYDAVYSHFAELRATLEARGPESPVLCDVAMMTTVDGE